MNGTWWRLVAFFALCTVLRRGGGVNILATVKLPDEEVEVLPLTAEQKNPYFKILNELDGKIYIGGKRLVVVFDPNKHINDSKIINFENGELRNTIPCATIAPEGEKDKICQHYIRVAERIGTETSTKFLFCGTNLLEPYCHLLNISDDQTDQTIGNFSAPRKVQYSVVQNSTSLYYNDSLFTGYNIEGRPNPSHIAKYTVTERDLVEIAATDDQNENLVNEPDFVGKPYVDVGEGFMYFFYRETAVEAVNQGKFVYSRVGRVCVDDNGNNKEIQTFFKARLNCSLQGEYPFYFNHIQDVIVEESEESDVIFHAVFTTTPHGPSSSAVCSYRLEDIKKVFETSQFKGKTQGKLPGPVYPPDGVDKSIFLKCDVGGLDNADRDFQEVYTLMDDLVPNYNPADPKDYSHPPLLYSTTMNFYSIAVDHTNSTDKIYYIGTEYGTILKAYVDDGILKIYEMEMLNINHPVTGLRYNNRKLLAVTEKGLYQIDVARCESSGCPAECNNFRHGYCADSSNTCSQKGSAATPPSGSKAYTSNKVQILTFEPNEIITSCANRVVELTCEVKNTSPLCGEVELFWRHGSETLVKCTIIDKGCKGESSTIAPFVQYQVISNQPNYKLVHLTVKVFSETKGEFSCSPAGKEGEVKVNVDVDESQGCLTKESYDERNYTRSQLVAENEALATCENTVGLNTNDIMFQECAKCPGDPHVNSP